MLMVHAEVCVPFGRQCRLLSQESSDRMQIHTGHHQFTGEGMSIAMPSVSLRPAALWRPVTSRADVSHQERRNHIRKRNSVVRDSGRTRRLDAARLSRAGAGSRKGQAKPATRDQLRRSTRQTSQHLPQTLPLWRWRRPPILGENLVGPASEFCLAR